MPDAKEILRSRLQQRLDETGRTAYNVSKAIGASDGYLRDLFDPVKTFMPSAERLSRIAMELQTTTDWLLGKTDSPAPVESEVGLGEHQGFHGFPREEPGIPLVGTGDCADLEVTDDHGAIVAIERSSFDPEYHVRYVTRPPALTGDRSAYAIYFHGSSMEPRFFAGEIGIAQPSRPAGPGDYVVVQLNNGESDDVVTVLVKRLVRQTAAAITLEQHNPPLIFSLPRRQVARIHRIMNPAELLMR